MLEVEASRRVDEQSRVGIYRGIPIRLGKCSETFENESEDGTRPSRCWDA